MQGGWSALYAAAYGGWVDICRLLVAEKANIDLKDNKVKKRITSFYFL